MSDLAKIREEELEALIKGEQYVCLGTLTLCVVSLRSGFKVVGKSACINPAFYDRDIGERVARAKAVEQLWELEAYHRMASLLAVTSEEEE